MSKSAEQAVIAAAVDKALAPYQKVLTAEQLERMRRVMTDALSDDPAVQQLAKAAKTRPVHLESGDRDEEGNPIPDAPPAGKPKRGQRS